MTLPEKLSIQVRGFDEEVAQKVGQRILEVLRKFSEWLPLQNLDGVTIAYNYAEALRDLDRGHTGLAPLTYTQDAEVGKGVAMAPLVKREDGVKTHLVLGPAVAVMFFDLENEANINSGIETVLHELGHVVEHQWTHQALDGVAFTPLTELLDCPLERFLHEISDRIWSEYCANRISTSLLNQTGDNYRKTFQDARDTIIPRVEEARWEYNIGSISLGDFVEVMKENLAMLLQATGYFLGLKDGEEDRGTTNEATERLYEEPESESLVAFHGALQNLWEKRGNLSSFRDFLVLMEPTEKLLEEIGVYPSLTEDRQVYLHIP